MGMRLVNFCHLVVLTFSMIGASHVALAQNVAQRTKASSTHAAHVKTQKQKDLHRNLAVQGFQVTEIPQYEIPPFLTREDLNKIVPTDVTSKSDSAVLQQMGDKAVQAWLKSSAMKDLSLVQTAQKVEQALKTEVELGDSEDGETKHKLNFQVQAIQSVSRVDYKGFFDMTLSYNMRDSKTGVEIREKIFKNKDLFLNHSSDKDETTSMVGMRWGF